MAKIEPAVTQLLYQVPDGTSYIDLAKDLSKVNRRLYRQGMTYVIQSMAYHLPVGTKATDNVSLSISTSGNSWIVHNAWKKGFAAWRALHRDVNRAMPGIEGRWADFKVYLDDSMEDATTLEPYAGDGAVYLAGEWEYSALVFDDDTVERDLKMHLIGSSNLADTNEESGIGLIHEYQISRRRPQDPDPDVPADASNSIYAKLLGTDEMTDRLVDNVESHNDSAPYDDVEYQGGATNADAAVPVLVSSCNATQFTAHTEGFIAPCGLLKLSTTKYQLHAETSVYEAASAPTVGLLITVATGPYRGVLAAPMGQ